MVAAITDAQSRADQFLNQLALPTAQAVQLINTSQGSAYEVYVLTLVLIGLQEGGGWTVELRQLAIPRRRADQRCSACAAHREPCCRS
jgi:hypothetical protein